MIALALDTSGAVGSVALVEDDTVRAERRLDTGMRHGVGLFPALAACLDAAGVAPSELDVVAVGTGPGSFTGVRVGVSAARALAWAAGSRLVGVPSCDALAADVPTGPQPLAVVTDARVRAVYVAVYVAHEGGWERDSAPRILPPDEAVAAIPPDALLVGDGPDGYTDVFAGRARAASEGRVRAEHTARIALRRATGSQASDPSAVLPLYLRRSSAERRAEERSDRDRSPRRPPARLLAAGDVRPRGGDRVAPRRRRSDRPARGPEPRGRRRRRTR